MKVYELLNSGADIQVGVNYYYYDHEKGERISIEYDEAEDRDIAYIYCEDDELCIEVEFDQDDGF